MRTLILGGTFDPVHVGHLFLAEEARLRLGYERVVFVPANVTAHRAAKESAPAADRLSMLEAAIGGIPYFEVDDCEISRGGVSYTVDTVAELVARGGLTGKPGLIIGDDLIEGFARWREPERIASLADLIVARRAFQEERRFSYPHVYLANLVLPISSSDIRSRVRSGQAYRHIVPEAVFRDIERTGRYR